MICRFKISCRGYVKKSVATMCHNGHKTEARSSPRLLNWHKRLTDPNPEQDEQSTQPLQAPSTELQICAPPWRTIRTNTHSLRKSSETHLHLCSGMNVIGCGRKQNEGVI